MTSVCITIEAPVPTVWEYISDIASHVHWMIDAHAITLESGTANTAGAIYLCDTRLGPVKTNDIMEIIRYDSPILMEIKHKGAVSGTGTFHLSESSDSSTLFVWEENLVFPRYMGSALGKAIAMTFLHRIWKKNLQKLKNEIELQQ